MSQPDAILDPAVEPDPTVRWRAWRMWKADGQPPGRASEYLQHAREAQAIDDDPTGRPLPNLVHIVDDDEAVRASLKMMLESAGYRARTWSSAVEVLQALPGLERGCLIVDVRMPVMDGLTLLTELRARKVKLPIIVITGHGDIRMAVRAMRTGAVDFIEKPFAKEEIVESLRVALRQKRSA